MDTLRKANNSQSAPAGSLHAPSFISIKKSNVVYKRIESKVSTLIPDAISSSVSHQPIPIIITIAQAVGRKLKAFACVFIYLRSGVHARWNVGMHVSIELSSRTGLENL
ncbi:hypothetical protein RRG08_012586 [Elysia crispata]|uniref:Uncharacterized protein n=1 Tax=Elysia crispata TaxID=231223 RepID=A0AAE1AIP9_9GAST|nr:hypothetical protein RRG08_012586 [Elysia crispata]